MIVINFAHPLTDAQKKQVEQIVSTPIVAIHKVPCQLENGQPFVPQIKEAAAAVPLTAEEWQTEALLINPPAYAPATTILLAELHGRMGYFPSFIRIRPVVGSEVPCFEVAEIINLQRVREDARQQR